MSVKSSKSNAAEWRAGDTEHKLAVMILISSCEPNNYLHNRLFSMYIPSVNAAAQKAPDARHKLAV